MSLSKAPPGAPATRKLTRLLPVAPAPAPPRRSWFKAHKVTVVLLSLLVLGATVGLAALLIRQDVTTTTSASNAVLKFQNGPDYASINVAGFATLSIPASGSSATFGLTGVSGAALTTLGDVLSINNTASSQNYTVTLTRSAAPNAAITSFVITVKDGASTLAAWDAVGTPSSGSFTHVAGRVLNVTVALTIADGTAAGSVGSFGMQFAFAPA